jgi:tRNA-Thr(GGU) m(6)t(6)A37 methyltransferase TsaA
MKEENAVSDVRYEVEPIGRVESPLVDLADAPKQGNEGAPDAWLVIDPRFAEGLNGLQVGDEVIVLSWLHRAQRDVLTVHPRGDPTNPLQGVFNSRSPDRPNPIGLHRVQILAIEETRILVSDLDAVDQTPIIDLKPVLDQARER